MPLTWRNRRWGSGSPCGEWNVWWNSLWNWEPMRVFFFSVNWMLIDWCQCKLNVEVLSPLVERTIAVAGNSLSAFFFSYTSHSWGLSWTSNWWQNFGRWDFHLPHGVKPGMLTGLGQLGGSQGWLSRLWICDWFDLKSWCQEGLLRPPDMSKHSPWLPETDSTKDIFH